MEWSGFITWILMRAQRAHYQAKPRGHERQHEQDIEQTGGLELKVEVEQDASQDDDQGRDHQSPPQPGSAIEENSSYAKDEGDERQTRGIPSPDRPIARGYRDAGCYQIDPDQQQANSDQEFPDAARSATGTRKMKVGIRHEGYSQR